jgi:hypothetical protein
MGGAPHMPVFDVAVGAGDARPIDATVDSISGVLSA